MTQAPAPSPPLPDAAGPTGTARRVTGVALLIIAALTTLPAAGAALAEATVIPAGTPPEAFLIPAIAIWLMSVTWWLHAALITIGLVLVISAPWRLWTVILGGAVALTWVIAMVFLVSSGMLFSGQA